MNPELETWRLYLKVSASGELKILFEVYIPLLIPYSLRYPEKFPYELLNVFDIFLLK